jgi:hypothetical protein
MNSCGKSFVWQAKSNQPDRIGAVLTSFVDVLKRNTLCSDGASDFVGMPFGDLWLSSLLHENHELVLAERS